jgi:hypothetical protein
MARYVATSLETYTQRNRYDEEQWRFEHEQDSIICTMPDAENQVANARLIAAAPELLEALRDAVSALEDIRQMAESKKRINMADGTSLGSFCRSHLLGKDAVTTKATGQS